MTNPFDNAGLFLIQTLFDLYIFIVMLRIVLQWVHTDYANPIFELVSRLTQPLLRPLQRLIPSFSGIDLPNILLLFILEALKLTLIVLLQINTTPALSGLIVLAFAELLSQLLNIFFYAVLALTILSWLNPLMRGPLAEVLQRLSEPLLRPARRFIPMVGGFDISPIPVLIGLKLITIIVVQPLIQIGATLALGGALPIS